MHKKNNLFELVKALSPSEKRYFRQSFSSGGKDGKNYLRLFNALEKVEAYDESVLKRTFKGERFTNQLHVTKIYLYDSLLKSLRLYHAKSSSSMIIKDHLKNIEVCFNKELYNVCFIEIQKASHLYYRGEIQNGRNDKAKQCLEELIEMLEASQERIIEDPGIYLSSMNNLLSFFVFTKQHGEALSILVRAKDFYKQIDKTKRSQNNFRQILRMYNIELEIYRDAEELEKGIGLIREIQNVIQQHSQTIPREYLISLWFQYAYIFFLKGDFKSSLRWINEMMNSSFAHLRPDLHIQTHFLNLMVHFELRNFFVMRYFVDATKRFGKKNQSFKDHHKKLIDFFARISRLPESEYGNLFAKLHADVVLPKLIPQNELDYINWNKWISSKVKGRLTS